jgi:hypothetical protein
VNVHTSMPFPSRTLISQAHSTSEHLAPSNQPDNRGHALRVDIDDATGSALGAPEKISARRLR